MATPAWTRARDAMVAGGLGGLAAGLVFATAHAFIIEPIWNRMFGGLAGATLVGAIVGWCYVELTGREPSAPRDEVRRGALFGALLWVSVTPVSLVDAAVRAADLGRPDPFYDIAMAAIAALVGGLWGWHRTRRLRGAVAGITATVALTMAMGGPVPIGRNVWALGIFLAVLPASVIAGALLGFTLSRARRRDIVMAA